MTLLVGVSGEEVESKDTRTSHFFPGGSGKDRKLGSTNTTRITSRVGTDYTVFFPTLRYRLHYGPV